MIELLNTGCMEYMAGLPDKSFDLGSGDPPYFKGVGKMGYFGKKSSSINVKRGAYKIPNWDNSIPTIEYFNELKRISKYQIIWGANYYDFIGPVHKTPRRPELNKWVTEHPVGWIVWDKLNGETDFNDFELAWTSLHTPTVIFKFLWNGMMQGESLSNPCRQRGDKSKNEKRIHPTQKPIALYDWQFRLKEFKSIFESHGGSASAAISADRLNIDMVLTEKDSDSYKAACKRHREQTAQIQLFK